VCPVKIDLHQQLFISRRELARRGLVPATKRMSIKMAAAVLRRPWLYRVLGHVARMALRWLPRSLVYSRWNVWGRQRELPVAPRASFRELSRKRKAEREKQ
jgi:L-lactate dehydrogenase complex protein LldF